MNKPATALFLVLAIGAVRNAAAAEPLPPARQWIPQEAVIAVEVTRTNDLLDRAFDPKVIEAVQELPVYRQQASTPGFKQFLGVVDYLEARLRVDWPTGIRKLVGGGVTLAVVPGEGALLVIDAEDGELLEKLHEIVRTFAEAEAANQGQPDRVRSAEYRGVTGWTFGGDEAHAIVGNRLVVSNKAELLKRVADLRADPSAKSLATLPGYQAARQAAGADASAVAFVNLETLKQHPSVHKVLEGGGMNPLVSLLFAGVTEALRASNWLALGVHVDEGAIALEAAVDAASADAGAAARFALPKQAGEGAMPILAVPRRIAELSLYRDLHAFYAAKDELFPERTSGLIFFENMMGIFFSGRDLTEEVLAKTRPEVRFVVAKQEYDPAIGTPRVQIPAVAAVFRMRDPEKFRMVAEEAWQKALGLINFTRGQQGQPGLILDRPTHGDTKFTTAYFSSAEIDDRTAIATHFNFRPALAVFDDYLILSSTEGLARDLIDAVKSEAAATVEPLAETHSVLEVDGAGLAAILGANRDNLVRQNMVNEGHTREQAEAAIDALLTIAQQLDQLTLRVGAGEGRPQANLEVKLNLP